MSNPFDGIISTEFKALFKNAIESLLDIDALSIACTLVYGDSKFTDCTNCVFDPVLKKSSGKYKSGGDRYFTVGTCPVCRGIGRFTTDVTATVYIVPIWNYKDWINWRGTTAQALALQGYVQTLSKMDTYNAIKSCKSIIIDSSLNIQHNHIFQRDGEPTPVGLGGSDFLITIWKAIA
jgi:hypothetical protein